MSAEQALNASGSKQRCQAPRPTPARAKARAAYNDFFTLWEDADLPILKEAKAECAKLPWWRMYARWNWLSPE